MDQKMMFQDVSPAELRTVEGGGILSWLEGAASWVGDHVWGALKDMAGIPGAIFGFKGSF
jgi:hypothetical protein